MRKKLQEDRQGWRKQLCLQHLLTIAAQRKELGARLQSEGVCFLSPVGLGFSLPCAPVPEFPASFVLAPSPTSLPPSHRKAPSRDFWADVPSSWGFLRAWTFSFENPFHLCMTPKDRDCLQAGTKKWTTLPHPSLKCPLTGGGHDQVEVAVCRAWSGRQVGWALLKCLYPPAKGRFPTCGKHGLFGGLSLSSGEGVPLRKYLS